CGVRNPVVVRCVPALVSSLSLACLVLFFRHTATTEIYTLSLHDALPICPSRGSAGPGASARPRHGVRAGADRVRRGDGHAVAGGDRKSTRLNSSHVKISYAVFCLKKKMRKGRELSLH